MKKDKGKSDNSRIGKWLAEKREEKDLSQQYVADCLDVTRTAVHYWESGKRTIYAVNLIEYCKVLGVDPRKLQKRLQNQ